MFRILEHEPRVRTWKLVILTIVCCSYSISPLTLLGYPQLFFPSSLSTSNSSPTLSFVQQFLSKSPRHPCFPRQAIHLQPDRVHREVCMTAFYFQKVVLCSVSDRCPSELRVNTATFYAGDGRLEEHRYVTPWGILSAILKAATSRAEDDPEHSLHPLLFTSGCRSNSGRELHRSWLYLGASSFHLQHSLCLSARSPHLVRHTSE